MKPDLHIKTAYLRIVRNYAVSYGLEHMGFEPTTF